jgi:hypothetical protein
MNSLVPLTAKWGRAPIVDPRSFGDAGDHGEEEKMKHELPPSRRTGASPMTRPSFVRSRTHARNSGAKTTVAVIFSSVGAVLAVTGLLVRFAIVSIVVIGLSVLATVAFLRTQFGAQRPAVALDQERPGALPGSEGELSPFSPPTAAGRGRRLEAESVGGR